MGMCGCSEGADFKLPGPDGVVYSVLIYQPCSYCETPGGIIIHRNAGEDLLLYDIESLPEPDWKGDNVFISVFDPMVLKKRLKEYATGWDDEDLDAEGFPDIMDDAVVEAVHRMGPLIEPGGA